jgi:HSP20 family molecular chaperone IbpA
MNKKIVINTDSNNTPNYDEIRMEADDIFYTNEDKNENTQYDFSNLQEKDFPMAMYVNSKEGLRVRLEPFINSDTISIYVHGQRVIVHGKSKEPVTIDNITNYWVEVGGTFYTGGGSFRYKGETYYKGWVFGGYLSEQLPENAPVVIGYWDDENDDNKIWTFTANHDYIEGYKGTSGNAGTWSLKNKILTIITIPYVEPIPYSKVEKPEGETTVIDLTVINRNKIILKYKNGEIINLIRNDKDGLW